MALSSEAFSELLLRALIVASIADGRRPEVENRVAAWVYRRATGEELSARRYDALVTRTAVDPEATWKALEAERDQLSAAQRDELVCGMIRVAMADAELQDEEIGVFRRLPAALGLTTAELRTLMNRVWHEERETPGPT